MGFEYLTHPKVQPQLPKLNPYSQVACAPGGGVWDNKNGQRWKGCWYSDAVIGWGIISKYFVERFWLTIKKNQISVVSINRIRFRFFSRYGWEKAHFSFSLFCFITKNKHQFCQNALMWQECPKFSLLLVLWPWAGNYPSGSSVFFIHKKKRIGQGDCQWVLPTQKFWFGF